MSIPSKEALQRHRAACEAGESGYMDPETGYFVMTSYHLRAGNGCCGNGCRHCPWPPVEQKSACRPDVPSYPWPE